jgi:hypothetical protein
MHACITVPSVLLVAANRRAAPPPALLLLLAPRGRQPVLCCVARASCWLAHSLSQGVMVWSQLQRPSLNQRAAGRGGGRRASARAWHPRPALQPLPRQLCAPPASAAMRSRARAAPARRPAAIAPPPARHAPTSSPYRRPLPPLPVGTLQPASQPASQPRPTTPRPASSQRPPTGLALAVLDAVAAVHHVAADLDGKVAADGAGLGGQGVGGADDLARRGDHAVALPHLRTGARGRGGRGGGAGEERGGGGGAQRALLPAQGASREVRGQGGAGPRAGAPGEPRQERTTPRGPSPPRRTMATTGPDTM